MVEEMISFLKKIFIDNWQRKLFAIILAIITWFFVNHSLTYTKTIPNIPVKVLNLPKDKTIAGIQSDKTLSEKVSLSLTGNKNFLANISSSDIEVVIDAKDHTQDFTILITKNNIISKNPSIKIERVIKKVKPHEFKIILSKLITEKIPVLFIQPIGEAPKGYQFLDLWPYQLYITVSGPEEIIKELKATGIKKTFNLNDISENELNTLDSARQRGRNDIVSFFVPTSWKKITIPSISNSPMEIDDPNARALRIDFVKKVFMPINLPIPIELFFPLKTSEKFNPKTITLLNNEFVQKKNNINMITIPLYAQGVSEGFLDIVKEKMQIIVLVESKEDSNLLDWSIQMVLPLQQEKSYISSIMSNKNKGNLKETQAHISEPYLKQRFRKYANRFSLWQSPNKKLRLNIQLIDNKVVVVPEK